MNGNTGQKWVKMTLKDSFYACVNNSFKNSLKIYEPEVIDKIKHPFTYCNWM